MALLFAEDGVHVSLSDPSEEAMDAVITKAEKSGYNGFSARQTLFERLYSLHQNTILSANRFPHLDSSSSPSHMAALATKSSKASCLTCLAMTSFSTAVTSILQTPSDARTRSRTQAFDILAVELAVDIRLRELDLPCAQVETNLH
jgi:hypothetical protein